MIEIKFPCKLGDAIDVIRNLEAKELDLMKSLKSLRGTENFEPGIEKDERYSVKMLWEELTANRVNQHKLLEVNVRRYVKKDEEMF